MAFLSTPFCGTEPVSLLRNGFSLKMGCMINGKGKERGREEGERGDGEKEVREERREKN